MKRPLLIVLKSVVACALLWVLVHTAFINIQLLAVFFERPWVLLGVVVLLLLTVVVAALRWYVLNILQQIDVGIAKTILSVYIGAAFNYIIPGAVGGDVVRLFYIFKHMPKKKNLALLTVLFDRVIGLFFVFVMITVACMMHLKILLQQPQLFSLFAMCAVMAGGLGLFLFFSTWLLQKFSMLFAWLHRYTQHFAWSHAGLLFFQNMNRFSLNKMTLFYCCVLSLIIQFFVVSVLILLAGVMHLPIFPVSYYVIALGIAQIANLLPITPGGIGVGEAVFAHVLLLLHPGGSYVYATIFFAYRLMSILTYLPGVIYYFTAYRHAKPIPIALAHSP